MNGNLSSAASTEPSEITVTGKSIEHGDGKSGDSKHNDASHEEYREDSSDVSTHKLMILIRKISLKNKDHLTRRKLIAKRMK